MMLGPLIGGWLVTQFGWQRGVQYALLACIVLGVMTGILQWFLAEPATAEPIQRNQSSFSIIRSFSPVLRELLVSDILIRFCERIPYTFVILWAMNHGKLSAQQFGYLIAIEMITAMLCYIPVAHLADSMAAFPSCSRHSSSSHCSLCRCFAQITSGGWLWHLPFAVSRNLVNQRAKP